MHAAPSGRRRCVASQLWFWVVVGISAGALFGLAAPDAAKEAKWLADAFLQLVKTITAPVIFLTVVVGIASLGDMAKAGGLAARALGYFFSATVVALGLGLLAGNLIKPGAGFAGGPTADAAGAAQEKIAEAGDAGHASSASSPRTCCRRASCSRSSRTRCSRSWSLRCSSPRPSPRWRRRCAPASW